MSLQNLAPEIITNVLANLDDLDDLHAVALTSRYLLTACLEIPSSILHCIFLKSYVESEPLLLAATKAGQLRDWIQEATECDSNRKKWSPICEERLNQVEKASNSFESLCDEALSHFPLSFQDLKDVQYFKHVALPSNTNFVFRKKVDTHTADHRKIKLLVLFHEMHYQLFRDTFGVPSELLATSPAASRSWHHFRKTYVKNYVHLFERQRDLSLFSMVPYFLSSDD